MDTKGDIIEGADRGLFSVVAELKASGNGFDADDCIHRLSSSGVSLGRNEPMKRDDETVVFIIANAVLPNHARFHWLRCMSHSQRRGIPARRGSDVFV